MAFDLAPFLERRRRFAEAIGDALAIIPGAREVTRNGDTNFEFRQDSDFYFLTGFDEPDAVAVINPAHAKERFVLFVRPRDREMEIWNGRRAGVEGAIATYGADAAYTVDELDAKLHEHAVDRPALVYRLGNPHHDARVTRLLAEMRSVRSRPSWTRSTRRPTWPRRSRPWGNTSRASGCQRSRRRSGRRRGTATGATSRTMCCLASGRSCCQRSRLRT